MPGIGATGAATTIPTLAEPRFDGADGKEFRPLTLWRDSVSGRLEWRWESWPPKRPLYGLQELADRPVAPVVVCEGEKATDAARRLLPGFVVVTSPTGSKSADKADWSPLHGRDVVIWPDADLPGDEYAKGVSKCAAEAKSIAVVSPPEAVKEGWDAADALAEGWTTERATELIGQAVPAEHRTATSNSAANGRQEQTTNFASCASFAWPVMDDAAYYGIAGDIVRTILPHSEADPVALLSQP